MLKSDPAHAQIVNSCHALLTIGKFDEAYESIKSVRENATEDINVNTIFGAAALGANHESEGNAAIKFTKRLPADVREKIITYWAQILSNHQRFSLARKVFALLFEGEKPAIEQYSLYFKMCFDDPFGESEVARVLEDCKKRFADHFMTHEFTALHAQRSGDAKSAVEAAQKALKLNSDSVSAFRVLAELAPSAATPQQLAAMSNFIRDSARPVAEKILAAFALGDAARGREDYQNAYFAYSAGNALLDSRFQSLGKTYDRAHIERLTREVIANDGSGETADQSAGDPRHIFIVGLPRSGKTLVERALALFPEVGAGGESPLMPSIVEKARRAEDQGALTPNTLSDLAPQYSATIRKFAGTTPITTDTNPLNAWNIGYIKRLFPNAVFIHSRRAREDVRWAIFARPLSFNHAYSVRYDDIVHFEENMAAVMDHWKQLYGNDIIDVGYEDFVRDPKKLLLDIIEQCGLDRDAYEISWAARTDRKGALSVNGSELSISQGEIGVAAPFQELIDAKKN